MNILWFGNLVVLRQAQEPTGGSIPFIPRRAYVYARNDSPRPDFLSRTPAGRISYEFKAYFLKHSNIVNLFEKTEFPTSNPFPPAGIGPFRVPMPAKTPAFRPYRSPSWTYTSTPVPRQSFDGPSTASTGSATSTSAGPSTNSGAGFPP